MPLRRWYILSNLCSLKTCLIFLLSLKLKRYWLTPCSVSFLFSKSLLWLGILKHLLLCLSFTLQLWSSSINFIFLYFPIPSVFLCSEVTTQLFHWNHPRDQQSIPWTITTALLLTAHHCGNLTSSPRSQHCLWFYHPCSPRSAPPSLTSSSLFHQCSIILNFRRKRYTLYWVWSEDSNSWSVTSFILSTSIYLVPVMCNTLDRYLGSMNKKYLLIALKFKQVQSKMLVSK